MEAEIEAYAGDDPREVLKFIIDSIHSNLLMSEEEFKDEWPDDTPTKYKINISIEKFI